MAPHKPLAKLISFKAIVLANFTQTVCDYVLGAIMNTEKLCSWHLVSLTLEVIFMATRGSLILTSGLESRLYWSALSKSYFRPFSIIHIRRDHTNLAI